MSAALEARPRWPVVDGEQRTPMWIRCPPCQHVWIAVWLPMPMTTVGKLLKGIRCPVCGGGPKQLRLARKADIPKSDRRPPREPPDREPGRKPERERAPKREPQPGRRKASAR